MPNYPSSYDDGQPHVKCTFRADHYLVEFAYDAEAVAVAKSALPAPKWDRTAKGWRVNPRSRKKLPEALQKIAAVFSAGNEAILKALAEQADTLAEASPHLIIHDTHATFERPAGVYAQALNDLAYQAGLRTKLQNRLSGPIRDVGKLLELAQRIPEAIEAAGKQKAARLEERRTEQAARLEERRTEQAARQKRRQNRLPISAAAAVSPGDVMKFGGKLMAVDGLGKAFRARGEDYSHMLPPEMWDAQIRYAYMREATPQELEEHARKEGIQKERAARLTAERDALSALQKATPASPDERNAMAEGELIWEDRRHAITGYSQAVYLHDDKLYLVTEDSSDGAAWGEFNFGYNCSARVMPATSSMIEDLRRGRLGLAKLPSDDGEDINGDLTP